MSKNKRPPIIPDSMPNYNFEEKSWFTKGYEKALEQKNFFLQKLDGKISQNKKKKSVIKKDISKDISEYWVWREFEKNSDPKSQMILMKNISRIQVSPYDLVKAWGMPNLRTEHKKYNLGLFYFEDCQLGKYMIYDVQENDSEYYKIWQEKSDVDAYNLFFQSKEIHDFRVQGLPYGDYKKFLRYVKTQIKNVQNGEEKSYLEKCEEKFGKIIDFNDYDLQYEDKEFPIVFTHNRSELNEILQNPENLSKIEDTEYNQKPKIQKHIKQSIKQFYESNFYLPWKQKSLFQLRKRILRTYQNMFRLSFCKRCFFVQI